MTNRIKRVTAIASIVALGVGASNIGCSSEVADESHSIGKVRAALGESDTLVAGQSLSGSAAIVSPNGMYKASFIGSDPERPRFGVYEVASGNLIWSSHAGGTGAEWHVDMQADGNLVVYQSNVARWAAATTGGPADGNYFMRIDDAGVLSVYRGAPSASSTHLWSSNMLLSGGVLSLHQQIVSRNGKYRASVNNDGAFVVTEIVSGRVFWKTTDLNSPYDAYSAKVTSTGNFVVSDQYGHKKWETGTSVPAGEKSFLQLEDSGVVRLYRGTPAAPGEVLFGTDAGTMRAYQPINYGEALLSPTKKFKAEFRASDGKFGVYEVATGREHWSTNVYGAPGWQFLVRWDGNGSLFDANSVMKWATGTNNSVVDGNYHLKLDDSGVLSVHRGPPGSPENTMWSNDTVRGGYEIGHSLSADQYIVSRNGKYRALLQADGNFVVYEIATSRVVWATNVMGPGNQLRVQGDGNLVVYNSANSPKWASNTAWANGRRAFLKLDDAGVLTVTFGLPENPQGVIWSSKYGRHMVNAPDKLLAQMYRPNFKLRNDTKCYPLTFSDGSQTQDHCKGSYDSSFVVVANIARPDSSMASVERGNTFRITYSLAFGKQLGHLTSSTRDVLEWLDKDNGEHGYDAQYLVVDVVDGRVISAWSDVHSGSIARTTEGPGLTMSGNSVTAWVGAYYHPLLLVQDRTDMCDANALSSNVTNPYLRAVCGDACAWANECPDITKMLNWGDLNGDDYSGSGRLVVAGDFCDTKVRGTTYSFADGGTFTGSVEALNNFIGCGPHGVPSYDPWHDDSGKSKTFYSASAVAAYNLPGCSDGSDDAKTAGLICNASYFPGNNTKWVTSRAANNLYIEPFTAGNADVDYAAGAPFNDISAIPGVPHSVEIRTGARVDKVTVNYANNVSLSHGGSGGGAKSMGGLENNPIVAVELCSGMKDGKSRAGHIKFIRADNTVMEGGDGYDSCRTIAPAGRRFYGFYGRSGAELDLLGTIWGDR